MSNMFKSDNLETIAVKLPGEKRRLSQWLSDILTLSSDLRPEVSREINEVSEEKVGWFRGLQKTDIPESNLDF
jgi:hypothetical protein